MRPTEVQAGSVSRASEEQPAGLGRLTQTRAFLPRKGAWRLVLDLPVQRLRPAWLCSPRPSAGARRMRVSLALDCCGAPGVSLCLPGPLGRTSESALARVCWSPPSVRPELAKLSCGPGTPWGCLPLHQGYIWAQFCCYDDQSEAALGKCGQRRGATAPLEFGTAS